MDLLDGIAIIALLVSGFSAWYSHKTITEAKNANKLSIQFERVKIYRHILDYQKCFQGLFANPNWERVFLFRDEAVVLSEIYFSSDIYEKVNEIFLVSNEWVMRISAFEGMDDPDIAAISEMKRDFKVTVIELIPQALLSMKEELKVNDV